MLEKKKAAASFSKVQNVHFTESEMCVSSELWSRCLTQLEFRVKICLVCTEIVCKPLSQHISGLFRIKTPSDFTSPSLVRAMMGKNTERGAGIWCKSLEKTWFWMLQ